MATNYQRGADFERRVVMDQRADGFAAWRVAGSRGPADVIAARPGEVRLIQCKTGQQKSFGPSAREQLALEAALAGARAFLAFRRPRARSYELTEV